MKLNYSEPGPRSLAFVAVLACVQFLFSPPSLAGTKAKKPPRNLTTEMTAEAISNLTKFLSNKELAVFAQVERGTYNAAKLARKRRPPRTLQECPNDSSLTIKMTRPILLLMNFLSDEVLATFAQVDRGTYYAAKQARMENRKTFTLSEMASHKRGIHHELMALLNGLEIMKLLKGLNENLEELDLSYLNKPRIGGHFVDAGSEKLLALIQRRFTKLKVLNIRALFIDNDDLAIISKMTSLRKLVIDDITPNALSQLINLTTLRINPFRHTWPSALNLLTSRPNLANLNIPVAEMLHTPGYTISPEYKLLRDQNNPVALAWFGAAFYDQNLRVHTSGQTQRWNKFGGFPQAKAALETAAASGNYYAQDILGCIYLDRNAPEEDLDKALSLFHQAADQGHPPDVLRTASMLNRESGRKEDFPKVSSLYEKVANLEDGIGRSAQLLLAQMYEKSGDLLALKNAHKWYSAAVPRHIRHIPSQDMLRVEAKMEKLNSKWETRSDSEH